MKGLSKGRYDETFAGEDAKVAASKERVFLNGSRRTHSTTYGISGHNSLFELMSTIFQSC